MPRGNWNSLSGTITSGGTAQTISPENPARSGFLIYNVSSGDLWFRISGTAAATQPSMYLAAGAYFETPDELNLTGSISIFGATTGQAFIAYEW